MKCRKIKKLAIENITNNQPIEKQKNNFLISIGREFGSGGKYIGQELQKG